MTELAQEPTGPKRMSAGLEHESGRWHGGEALLESSGRSRDPSFLQYLAVLIKDAHLGKPISDIQPHRQFAPLGRGGNVRHASLLQIGPRARLWFGDLTVPPGGWPSHSISIVMGRWEAFTRSQ